MTNALQVDISIVPIFICINKAERNILRAKSLSPVSIFPHAKVLHDISEQKGMHILMLFYVYYFINFQVFHS